MELRCTTITVLRFRGVALPFIRPTKLIQHIGVLLVRLAELGNGSVEVPFRERDSAGAFVCQLELVRVLRRFYALAARVGYGLRGRQIVLSGGDGLEVVVMEKRGVVFGGFRQAGVIRGLERLFIRLARVVEFADRKSKRLNSSHVSESR